MSKIRVAVVFGGRSAEHEISLLSAQNVVASLDPTKYEPVLIGIDRAGRWFLNEGSMHLLDAQDAGRIRLAENAREVGLVSTGPSSHLVERGGSILGEIDVLFPVLHGPYGEDGTIQGLAKLADIPCVGAGVLGSAVGMDKDVMKRLLRDAGIDVAPFLIARSHRPDEPSFDEASAALGTPIYIKPANQGSSVGISRVRTAHEYRRALATAFTYDRKVVVEQEMKGREIECSVLGNEDPVASIPGEIVPADGFYSYAAKYLDENGAQLLIPADLDEAQTRTVQETAIRTYEALCCEGMARVDGFLTADDRFVVNEINTIPGFTRISMYPKLFEASGIGPAELTDRLIQLAIDRHEHEQRLKLTPEV
ncbi:MAG: D-alanine--D-alanine ligase [Spirochaetota bacterium]